jgi:hypothetical protein
MPAVLCGSPDQPLRIGDINIPCYVLEDERRVLVQRGMMDALDMSQGTASGKGDGDRLSRFVNTRGINPFVDDRLRDMIIKPIRFKIGGSVAYGYEATILADICESVLRARKEGGLNYQAQHIADRCEMLMCSFAKVGIIALVDEATGFQYIRQRDSLEQLLKEFLADEYARWARAFPASYFKEMCRLRGISYRPDMKLPRYFGHLTNDIIYQRLAPYVLEELRRRNPVTESGYRAVKHHQWLSEDIGHPKLNQHFGTVTALMKISPTWEKFMDYLNIAAPSFKHAPLLAAAKQDDNPTQE